MTAIPLSFDKPLARPPVGVYHSRKPMKNLLIGWLASAASLLVVAYVLPGFHVAGIQAALIAALVIGLVNGTLGVILKVVTFPLSFLTLGLFWLVINALMLLVAAKLVSGFAIDGFLPAFFGSILLSLVNWAIRSVVAPGRKD
jgi:putative membrane protein